MDMKWTWGSCLAHLRTREASAAFSQVSAGFAARFTFLSAPSVPEVANASGLSRNCCYITGAKSAYLCNIYYLKRLDPDLSLGSNSDIWGLVFLKTYKSLKQICTSWVLKTSAPDALLLDTFYFINKTNVNVSAHYAERCLFSFSALDETQAGWGLNATPVQ